jgi:hypothetical protein
MARKDCLYRKKDLKESQAVKIFVASKKKG